MDKHLDTLNRTIELAETCLEGIEHMKKRLNEGYIEDTITLFKGIVEAYYHMEILLQALSAVLPANQLKELTLALRHALEQLTSAYENNEWNSIQEIIRFTLLPAYKKWKSEIAQAFSSYTYS
ncbi:MULTISPECIES: hypothetical protein [Bacillales]|uniref:hypothetical protein n=1 Tax=Bacillales TaxID=1385 RepID=UPI0006A790BE|nr:MULTISPECIES: hypothetical protein [Bacillales]OBZ10275.1 hypothetical protein A7975_23280 [Bacillus sp. FJAT-26390]